MLSHYPNDYSNMCYYSMMPWSYAGINWPFNPEKTVLQKIVSYQIMFKKTITQVCVTSPLCDLMLVSWPLGPEKKNVFTKDRYLSNHFSGNYSRMCYFSMMSWSSAGINWPIDPWKKTFYKRSLPFESCSKNVLMF